MRLRRACGFDTNPLFSVLNAAWVQRVAGLPIARIRASTLLDGRRGFAPREWPFTPVIPGLGTLFIAAYRPRVLFSRMNVWQRNAFVTSAHQTTVVLKPTQRGVTQRKAHSCLGK
jgi:hypothetical protein